jgi:hypothetical protein
VASIIHDYGDAVSSIISGSFDAFHDHVTTAREWDAQLLDEPCSSHDTLFSIKRRKLETIPWHKANPDLTALQVPDSCMNPVHTVSHVPDFVFVNPRKRKRLQDNSTVSFIHDNGNAVIRNASSAFHNHDVNDKRINVHGVYDFSPGLTTGLICTEGRPSF